jgi:hypothetical protein
VVVDRVDVVGERERHHIGVEPVDHRARLLARAAVRLADRDRLAGLGLPLLRERGVELLIQLAGRVVADVEERGVGVGRESGEAKASGGGQGLQVHEWRADECTGCEFRQLGRRREP